MQIVAGANGGDHIDTDSKRIVIWFKHNHTLYLEIYMHTNDIGEDVTPSEVMTTMTFLKLAKSRNVNEQSNCSDVEKCQNESMSRNIR